MKNTIVMKQAARGQVTVPAAFRKALGITQSTLYKAVLRGESIVLTPFLVEPKRTLLRRFSKRDIVGFLAEDKLDRATARKVTRLLK